MDNFEQILKPGNQLQFEFSGRNFEKNSFPTTIIRSIQKDLLYLLMNNKEPALDQLQKDTEVTLISQNDEKEDYVFMTRFIQTRPTEIPILVVNRPTEVIDSARRSSFRCDVKLPFVYFFKQKEYLGEVSNLSANGLMAVIDSNQFIEIGNKLVFKIQLPKVNPLMCVGKIVSIRSKENKQGVSLNFQETSKEFQTYITRYLFEQQRFAINTTRKSSVSR
ncbi:MAG TPA: PilZ domain-containing protein [Bacillota bacterium]|nr:PilZ domain-containing protein [Bacillota bacterium]